MEIFARWVILVCLAFGLFKQVRSKRAAEPAGLILCIAGAMTFLYMVPFNGLGRFYNPTLALIVFMALDPLVALIERVLQGTGMQTPST